MNKFQTLREACRAREDLDQDRLARELEQIKNCDLVDEFYDLYVSGRAGVKNEVNSLVAYALGITTAPPQEEFQPHLRYVNARVSMPDIDLDFPDDQRDQLIKYTFEKYGSDRVAQIITFGTMGARAAIRDAGRALDLPQNEVDRVARLVPAIPGMPITIQGALEGERAVSELQQLYEEQDYVHELLDTAQSLEGVARHASTHAAGVVVTDEPLVEYCPLHRPTRGDSDDALPVTQYPMEHVEAIGLLKVDFLGLSTLTVMRRASELIEKYQGEQFDMQNIPLDDPAIYELLSSGDVTGIFQVEGAGLRRVLQDMQPRRFEHIIAAISLYRPGPMEYIPTYIARMQGREKIEYRHPKLKPILEETYGIIVFQEQIIRIARDLAGYDAGQADTIRKAVGKKKKKQLLEHKKKFIQGATNNGIPREVAQGIFEDIEFFARYGFNKAHAADYAMITCQTAYLKAHYPIEYMAALLSVEKGNTDKVAFIVGDCHSKGIKLLPPDVNHSDLDFTIETLPDEVYQEDDVQRRRGIRFGMGAVKNVGEGPVEAILDARREGGPFQDLDDFCRRVDLRQVQRRALECLIKVGAFDRFGTRDQLLAVVDRMLGVSQQAHQAAEVGQLSMFGGEMSAGLQSSTFDPLPDVPETPHKFQLGWEKELTGLFLSEHPLHRMIDELDRHVTARCGEIDTSMAGQTVTLAGLVTSVRRITTRKGDPMAFAQIEDLQGTVEVTIFPRTWEQTRQVWEEDNLVILSGRVDERNDRAQVICNRAKLYQPEESVGSQPEEEPVPTTNGAGQPAAPPPPPADRPRRESTEPATETTVAQNGAAQKKADDAPPAAETATPSHDSPPDAESDAVVNGASEKPAASGAAQKNGFEREQAEFYLIITVKRSGDEETDIQQVGRVYDILTSYEGHDRFSLVVANGGTGVRLDFPNDTTRYCLGLQRSLEAVVGREGVDVRPAD